MRFNYNYCTQYIYISKAYNLWNKEEHSHNSNLEYTLQICSCYKLPQRHLERLVISRGNLLKSKYFSSLEDLEKYAEESVSSIYYLLLVVAGVANIHADHVASHLGKAQGITNILRYENIFFNIINI